MTVKALSPQIPFRYRNADGPTGITRKTARRLADSLGVDETQAIHLALRQLAARVLPQYEADDGPLTDAQMRQIKKLAAVTPKKSVRSSLLEIGQA